MAYTNLSKRKYVRLGGKFMDKDWQKFTMTGSVQDYLSYCNKQETENTDQSKMKQTGEKNNGTDNYSAWHGNGSTTYW